MRCKDGLLQCLEIASITKSRKVSLQFLIRTLTTSTRRQLEKAKQFPITVFRLKLYSGGLHSGIGKSLSWTHLPFNIWDLKMGSFYQCQKVQLIINSYSAKTMLHLIKNKTTNNYYYRAKDLTEQVFLFRIVASLLKTSPSNTCMSCIFHLRWRWFCINFILWNYIGSVIRLLNYHFR